MATEMNAPVQLISIDDDGTCHVQGPAIEVLRRIPGRLAVVGVAGIYRTGKSFLLNRLLGLQNGFDIGSTVNPCTKGVWIWGQPLEIAPDYHCIFLDTEGLASTQRTRSCDLQIFSFCILLSSLFIYNSVGAIDEQAIDDLHLVLHIAQHIHAKSRVEHGDRHRADLAQYLPSFLWVLRDFHLRLQNDDGEAITGKQYLENALEPLHGQEEKNQVRATLKDLFSDRDCVSLVRPAVEEEDLRHLQKLPYESLRPQFREQLEGFVKKVKDGVQPKMIEGSPVTGAMLAGLAEEYCNAINNSAVPNIESSWSSVLKQQLRASLKEAVDSYQVWVAETTAQRLPMSDDQLRDLHGGAKDEAFKLFKASRLDEDSPHFQEYRSELSRRLKLLYKQTKSENLHASRRQCEKVASTLYDAQIACKLHVQGSYPDVDTLMQDWEHVRTAYMLKTAGPAQGDVLSTWLFQRMSESVRTLSGQLRADADKRTCALEEKLSELQKHEHRRGAFWKVLISRRYREAISSLAGEVQEVITASRAGGTSKASRIPHATDEFSHNVTLHV